MTTGQPPVGPQPVTVDTAYIAERLGLNVSPASVDSAQKIATRAGGIDQETADAVAALLGAFPAEPERRAS